MELTYLNVGIWLSYQAQSYGISILFQLYGLQNMLHFKILLIIQV